MSYLEPKLAGYAGFQSYGVKPYPSRKPGNLETNDLFSKTRRTDDSVKFYDNFRRTDNTMYKTEISENTVPQDYRDLKIIKKGQGQKDLRQFLSSFEMGSVGRGLLGTGNQEKIFDSEIDQNNLKSQIEYHKKFLDENTKLVKLKDLQGLKGAVDNGVVSAPGQYVMSIIEDPEEYVRELHLPENLVPMWRVHNDLYEIYYIPGYDNWLYKGVKEDPESVHKLSKYKKKFFETLTVQKLSKTHSNFGYDDNSGTRRKNNLKVEVESEVPSTLPIVRPNSVQNFRTVNLRHSQFNQTGFYPSGKQEETFSKTGTLPRPKDGMLKSGTEFWQTTYQAGIKNPWKDCQRELLIPSLNRKENKEEEEDTQKRGRMKRRINMGGRFDRPTKPKGKRLLTNMRANSTAGTAWRNKGHKTQCRTGVTEFNFAYGKLGSNPRSIMPKNSNWKPFINDPLKYGTTSLTNHIPGYAGFIPNTNIHYGKAVEHGKGRNPRKTFIKENIIENFDNYIPGYAGYKPRNEKNKPKNTRSSIYYGGENLDHNE